MERIGTKYIVWFDYGYEGWKHTDCETPEEVLQAIHTSYGQPYVVTMRLDPKLLLPA